MSENNKVKIDVSTKTLFKVLLFVLAVFFLYYIRRVIVLLFAVIIIVAVLSPLVGYLTKRKVPQILAVLVAYILVFGILGLIIYIIVPPLIHQITNVSSNLPYYIDKLSILNINISDYIDFSRYNLSQISSSLSRISGGVIDSVIAIFGGVASAITVIVLSFYLLLERESLKEFIFSFIPEDKKEWLLKTSRKVFHKLGGWARGQLILAVTIGVVCYIVLRIIGVPYSLLLAILAGLLEIVPIVGPIVAGVVAALVAMVTGTWWQVLAIIISYTLIQQLENHFLVPNIMSKYVGFSPVIIIIALLIGAELGGIVGAILAIPIAAAGIVVTREWYSHNKEHVKEDVQKSLKKISGG